MNFQKISLKDACYYVKTLGDQVTFCLIGEPGIGKTQSLRRIAHELHLEFHLIDANLVDISDLTLPMRVDIDGEAFVQSASHLNLGLHNQEKKFIFIDELGRANEAVKNALLPLIYERRFNDQSLAPGSIVVCAMNAAGHNLKDKLLPQEINRMALLHVEKPSADEWCAWAEEVQLDPQLIGFAMAHEELFQSYEKNTHNEFIFKPNQGLGVPFCSPRSLARLDVLFKNIQQLKDTTESIPEITLIKLAEGIIGTGGANLLRTYLAFAKVVPPWQKIMAGPLLCEIPLQNGRQARREIIYLVFRAIEKIKTPEEFDAWLSYLHRFDDQNIILTFYRSVQKKESLQLLGMQNLRFIEQLTKMGWAFA